MSYKSIRNFYWALFGLSLLTLALNFGLGLFALGIIILPVLMLHLVLGLSLDKVQDHKSLIILSSFNLLAFALVRPDGVHTISDNGLSSFLELFGIYAGYDAQFENLYFLASIILLVAQLVIELRLRKLKIAGE
jgi:hypothetical protein